MSEKCNCNPYPGVPVLPCPPCPPKPGRPCPPPPPPPPFKPLPGGTQQYIGARYVPVFADPIEWDINKPYESLTIVTYQGNSYTSKCAVPGGTEITNTRYWAKTGDYNAQVAEYRAAVGDLSTQVTGFAKDNAEFREKIDKYDKDNAAMKNEVAAATARVDDLAKRVDTAEADIDGLQATTNQHTQKLADLEAADTRLAQSIADNDTDIAALQTKDVQHDSEISAIKTVNDQQGAAIAQNTADIAQNKKNIADNAKNIAENAAELAKHANTLKEHTADLAALHRDVQDNKTAIAKNASDIVGLRADLTEAEADIAQNTDGVTHLKADVVRIDAKDTEQDNIIGNWKTDHPGQTISECATSQENELAEHAGQIAKLETDKQEKNAFYSRTPDRISFSVLSGKVKIYYGGRVVPAVLELVNNSITDNPYLVVQEITLDGVIKRRWFHLSGNAVLTNDEFTIPCDTGSTPDSDATIPNPVRVTLLSYNPDESHPGHSTSSLILEGVMCYLISPVTP